MVTGCAYWLVSGLEHSGGPSVIHEPNRVSISPTLKHPACIKDDIPFYDDLLSSLLVFSPVQPVMQRQRPLCSTCLRGILQLTRNGMG